ncbi:Peptidoglycan-binding domain 1 protein [Methanolacinia petrolearia DSM 11571]|uniref:Peptidoglycan-binding domain 1 protein n=1 Tax=Methanolacinia petrolearia (strain DSM 11571 / OCM 486 / SEBR 4847) TaxID=679926 RepID=E1RFJ2_METP4|nr:peptidoglycan-binding domain-containing protein [Methanolacinia petrolearia]ADN36222.1 Peptidoglycan-binding domain 1 protein [Methanolacinia petrolearia DSM 11571]
MSLKIGSKGEPVCELQSKLKELGYDPGEVDGNFGQVTRKAVSKFQENKGLSIDGVIGPESVNALGIKTVLEKPEPERLKFRELLLTNPNYFGNIKASKFKAVKSKKQDTSFEELKCLGYNPYLSQLEAVIHIKKDYGYGGDICSCGTPEYVRFYIDWNNDGNWKDLGVVNFTAHDIPGEKPLEYAVTLDITPKKKWCKIENLPAVRAILSWNDPPEPDNPNAVPVWGNTIDARIQMDKLKFLLLNDYSDLFDKYPNTILEQLDLTKPFPVKEPKKYTIAELAEIYKGTAVPANRFAFTHINKLLAKPAIPAPLTLELSDYLSKFDIKIPEIIKELANFDGNTNYEELRCVGYDSSRRMLTGVLTIKLPGGYSGGLCTKGSTEYVAFWEYDEIEAVWSYLGTEAVNVHDISSIPKEDLQYAVSLNVDLSHHRRPCTSGPSEVKIRAILSWEVPPPPANPNWVPKYGNREETRILIKPGPVPTGEHTPYIETVGNMAVCDISQATGLATGNGIISAFYADSSPFGGTVTITGFIDNPPGGVLDGVAAPVKYKISVRPYNPADPQPWQDLNDGFNVKVRIKDNDTHVQEDYPQKIDPADGFYTYLEDPGIVLPGSGATRERYYVLPVLAYWQTGSKTGIWEILIVAKDVDNPEIPPGVLHCGADGTTRCIIRICLDNEYPVPQIGLTGYQRGADPTVHPIGTGIPEKCGRFKKGDILHGTYSVSDEHFGQLTLAVFPGVPAGGATVNPPVRSFDIVPTEGESGTWTLDTESMDPCGYIIRLWVRDRTIVNSGTMGFRRSDDVGFCLEKTD